VDYAKRTLGGCIKFYPICSVGALDKREKTMGKDVIDIESYRLKKARRMWKNPFAGFGRSPWGVPSEIFRILHLVFDAPDDPPLVKLAWLLSHFGEVPLPGGRTYRLERGRLEEKNGDGWEPSASSFNDLAGMVSGLTRQQWQWIARGCQPRKKVFSFEDWVRGLRCSDPSKS
jgi:hypothetical protein